jgi:hypothetical protein
MKLPHKSDHPFASGLDADFPVPPKTFRWRYLFGGSAAVFLLCLTFARFANSASFAEHPERSIRRAALITAILATSALIGRSLNRPCDDR